MRVTELPECNSSIAETNLKSAIQDNPSNRGRVEIYSVKDLKDCGIREDNSQQLVARACSGTLYTNAGQLPTNFHMKWIDKDRGEWFLQTSLCPAFGLNDGWKPAPTGKARKEITK